MSITVNIRIDKEPTFLEKFMIESLIAFKGRELFSTGEVNIVGDCIKIKVICNEDEVECNNKLNTLIEHVRNLISKYYKVVDVSIIT